MEIGWGDINREQQAQGIDKDVALTSFHTLMSIKATDPGRFLDRLDTLRIHDRCARLRILAHSLAFGFSQGREQAKPGAFEA